MLSWLPPEVGAALSRLPPPISSRVEEVRLRADRPLTVTIEGTEWTVDEAGRVGRDPGFTIRPGHVLAALQRMAEWSVYTLDEELRRGYLTLPGGHRVGLAGRTAVEQGRVLRLRDVASLCVRLARRVPGAADRILPLLQGEGGRLLATLVVAPPRAGKTTLLRELVCAVASGRPELGLPAETVVVVDERSEIAASDQGVPPSWLGPRVDVLDGCPKEEGLCMALRSLAPQILVTDELGGPADAEAVADAARAGVRVLASVHGAHVADVSRRTGLGRLLDGVFSRTVVLSPRPRPGTVLQVLDGDGKELAGPGQGPRP